MAELTEITVGMHDNHVLLTDIFHNLQLADALHGEPGDSQVLYVSIKRSTKQQCFTSNVCI